METKKRQTQRLAISSMMVFVVAFGLVASACVDLDFDSESLETGVIKPGDELEKGGGEREAVALLVDRRLGFLRRPSAGSSDWTFELVSDHGFDNPADPIPSSDGFPRSVASHPTNPDIVYVQTHLQNNWLKIFEVNLATSEVVEVFSAEDLGFSYLWGQGMGTDCAGHLYLTRLNLDAANITSGEVLELDLGQPSPGLAVRNHWSYTQEPPHSHRPAYSDLVGDFDGSVWGLGAQLGEIIGPDATTPVTPTWTPTSQLEEPFTTGVALSRQYLADGEIQEFVMVSNDFDGYDQDVVMVRPDEDTPLTQVGDFSYEPSISAWVADLATLPGWCLCGGPVKEELDLANARLDDLLYTLFYLDWDIRNAQAGTSPLAVFIEPGVLAFEDAYECWDEATVNGLEDCYADLEAQQDLLLDRIDELEQILEDRGCDLGDL